MARIKSVWWLAVLVAALPTVVAAQAAPAANDKRQPGLYWTLETDLGNISCKLYEKEAPNTVRTMVGLAIGKISYQDPITGATMKKRYFDGLTFHRVIPNFMIQGGDPTGTGSGGPGGPGFPYKNENVPQLKFDVAGRLAMANRGKDTNGSQFFITEAPVGLPANTYTIWGQCGDLNVVKAIARVPTTGDHPNKPPHIKRVVVERVGPAPANAPESMP
jgi:peptidyl-prolyl cis-trans isomerase A (cyclophilin A)